jgi:hypothetical protein
MATPRHSPGVLLETVRLIDQHGSVASAARATGIPEGTLRSRHTASKRIPSLAGGDSTSATADGCEVSRIVPRRVRTLADLVEACEIDTETWEVERWVCNKWEAAGKGDDGKMHVSDLYQVKAWLKRRVAVIAARAEIQSLINDAKLALKFRPATKAAKPKTTGYMLEVSIPDLHVGKLAWAEETGGNYDSRIAERLFESALTALIERTSGYTFERILYVCGNDLLHSDSRQGTTASGTPLDTDSRFQKSFGIARRMTVRAIDRLHELAPVHVALVPGNHDTLSVWHLGDSLECWYRNTPGVTIDNAPTPRKYVHFGAVMLLLTHGDKGRRENYPLLMATEQPEMFGQTRHREAHTGHLHQLRVQEHMGVRVRIAPSLTAPDAWHSEHHFVGNQRAAEAFVWHKDEGLVGTACYTVPAGEGKDAA